MSRRQIIDMQVRLPEIPPIRGIAKPTLPNLRVYGSDVLFDGSNIVGIEHAGSLYQLKITRQGKLILNK
ncbi:MAG: hemin uptake protein HemP [Phyllobacterium sp.]|uniref:hemin uptake protein HemP n=1 Tax=Phyllobacterium sp. TaxID=1871046 RepID=UPI0030F1501C